MRLETRKFAFVLLLLCPVTFTQDELEVFMYKSMELMLKVSLVAQLKIIEVIFVVFPELGELSDTERPRTAGSRMSTKRITTPSFFIFTLWIIGFKYLLCTQRRINL